jgi:hypothetical protein
LVKLRSHFFLSRLLFSILLNLSYFAELSLGSTPYSNVFFSNRIRRPNQYRTILFDYTTYQVKILNMGSTLVNNRAPFLRIFSLHPCYQRNQLLKNVLNVFIRWQKIKYLLESHQMLLPRRRKEVSEGLGASQHV